MAAATEPPPVELQPHQEYEQDQAQLAEQVEDVEARGGKERGRHARREPTEQRWAEQDARHQLPDHAGLPDLAE
jgi:hypothetical protein